MFKTIDDCRLDLVAHSMMVGFDPVNYAQDEIVQDPLMDFMPCSAARVSFGNEDKTGEDEAKDIKLMKYLANHQHMTPFEYQHATFLIECPLFIRSQIHRHRAFSYNEISRRYTSEELEFWIPTTFRGQSESNRQASSDAEIVQMAPRATYQDPYAEGRHSAIKAYRSSCLIALGDYNWMIKSGVAREQARAVLPQALLTKFYMGGNLRSWSHFIALRSDEHAQQEVQVIANRIAKQLKDLWPNSCAALEI